MQYRLSDYDFLVLVLTELLEEAVKKWFMQLKTPHFAPITLEVYFGQPN